jgi:trimeric autotransporter adhesin
MRALLITIFLLLSSALHATDVSGVINSNTNWTLAGSPYVMTGDIEVRAVLTLEPGVLIQVSALKGMKVFPEGRLIAAGTPTLPVVMTSVRDVSGGTPMAGDWGYLHIVSTAFTVLPSELRFFKMRFGKALKLEVASPLLRNCIFEGQLEAAILMDLSSSPIGEALSATGNGVNGIVVPAGELTGQTRWTIRSLPYVVRGGLLHVGARPPALKFDRDSLALAPKALGTLQLTLADPAPNAITITLASSQASVATAPASVTIAQDQYTAEVPITAELSGSAVITASAPGLGSAAATVTVAPLPSIFLATSGPATVGLNRSRQVSMFINSVAPPGGLNVVLGTTPSGKIETPTGLLLPSNGSGKMFQVSGLSLGSAVLNASGDGYVSANLPLEVVPLSMAFSEPVSVPIGTRNIPLQLSHDALAGGGVITLSSDNPAVLTLPASATFPGLSNRARVPMQGITEGTATVTASSPEYGQTSTLVQVQKLAVSFQTSATRIPIGMIESYFLRLNDAAPNEGLSFNLSSSNPAVASVSPSVITIVPGQFFSTVKAQITVHSEGAVSITASNPTTLPATLAVDALARGQFVFSASNFVLGNVSSSQQVQVGIFSDGEFYYPQTPLDVQFTVSDPAKLTAELYNGGLRGNDQIQLSGLSTTTTPVTVQASFPDVLPAATPLSVTVVNPTVQFNDLDGVRGLTSPRDDFYLTWRVPGSSDTQQTPSANQTMALSIVDATPAGIIDGFYDAANGSNLANAVSFSTATNRSATRYVGAATDYGDYKVRATSAAFGAFTSDSQSIQGFNLQFTRSSVTMGKGMRTGFGALGVQRRIGAAPQSLSTPLTVTLQNSDPSRVTAPMSVTIPAFASAAAVELTGLELTQAVTLGASAPAYTSGPAVSIKVVDPVLQIQPQSSTIYTDGGRMRVDYQLSVPAGPDVVGQFPIPGVTVGVSVEERMPANVVDGIYATQTGGAPVTSVGVNFQTGQILGFIGEPISAGSLRLRASISGNPGSPWTSNVIPILVNQVQLQSTSFRVIKGLKQHLRITSLGPVPSPYTAALSCSLATVCTVTPPTVTSTFGEFDLFGVGLGATTMTLQNTPATYGTQAAPVQVVPLEMYFYDNGRSQFGGGSDRAPSGGGNARDWVANFTSPNIAPQPLNLSLELVDVTPANAASLNSTPLSLNINQNDNGTDDYNGFKVNLSAIGTFKFKATIPGIGIYTSPPQSTLKFDGPGCRVEVGSGYKVRAKIKTSLAPAAPVTITAACTPSTLCTPEGTATLAPGSTQVDYFIRGGTQLDYGNLTFSSSELGTQNRSINVLLAQFYAGTSSATVAVGAVSTGAIGIFIGSAGGSDCIDRDQLAAAPIAFTLSSSNPTVATVPNLATMLVNTDDVNFPITALSPGTTTITVTFPGVGVQSFVVTVTP